MLKLDFHANRYKNQLTQFTYDLFFGTCVEVDYTRIYDYISTSWKDVDQSYHKNGVYTWSIWKSCIAYNTLFSKEFALEAPNALETIIGKLSAIDPLKDQLLFFVFYTLYQTYGEQILVDIDNAIPQYRESKEELIFTIESGQYPVVIGIDGYFRDPLSRGYPIKILYSSFNEEKYPVTTVTGNNIIYIPENTTNRKGAEFVIDFMATEIFQSYLVHTYFTPILGNALANDTLERFRKKSDNAMNLSCDEKGFDEFKQRWESLIFLEAKEDAGNTK